MLNNSDQPGQGHECWTLNLNPAMLAQSLPGHRDAISGMAFRQGTHELYSCAFDRTIKLWSCDDCTYVDTLFGHQVTPFFGRCSSVTWGSGSRVWDVGYLLYRWVWVVGCREQ